MGGPGAASHDADLVPAVGGMLEEFGITDARRGGSAVPGSSAVILSSTGK
jgi:hypothetical protein